MSDTDEKKLVEMELKMCTEALEDDSKRADDIIAFTKSVQDPFHENYMGENLWVSNKSGGGGGCSIL